MARAESRVAKNLFRFELRLQCIEKNGGREL